MFEDFRADLAHYDRRPRQDGQQAWGLLWWNYGLQALLAYRLGRWITRRGLRSAWLPVALLLTLPCLILTAYVRLACDIHLDRTAEIGAGLYIGHFAGIHLRGCRLGRGCSLQQEVRLEPAPGAPDGPEIGDRVWIGAHVRIIGPLRVGDRATIGAGTEVTQDVAAGCLVLGGPARVARCGYDNSPFL
jgi:serine acetyltransferase